MTEPLIVYMAGVRVGTISADRPDAVTFQYDPDWIAGGGLALSARLPLRAEAFGPDEATPFFENLLPESAIRRNLARQYRVGVSNVFELLRHLGGDCAGAITIVAPEDGPARAPDYLPLSNDELERLLLDLPDRPLAAGQDGVRLSLAGAQDKLPVWFDGERFALPRGGAPSTHIIKPPIPGLDGTVVNEAFCMTLAARAGLSAADVTIRRELSVPVLVVRRYDRVYTSAGRFERIPQEDFCQALGIRSDYKYEADGGPALRDCFTYVLHHCTNPAGDRLGLLDWLFFNLVIGNADAHAKNISLLRPPKGPRLAPFYDLMSTNIYPNLNKKLAMTIGGQHDPRYLFAEHWQRLATDLDMKRSFLAARARETLERISAAVEPAASALDLRGGEFAVIEKTIAVINSSERRLAGLTSG